MSGKKKPAGARRLARKTRGKEPTKYGYAAKIDQVSAKTFFSPKKCLFHTRTRLFFLSIQVLLDELETNRKFNKGRHFLIRAMFVRAIKINLSSRCQPVRGQQINLYKIYTEEKKLKRYKQCLYPPLMNVSKYT